jgi:hypothetical protein
MEPQPMLCGNGFAVSRNLNPNLVRIETLKPLGRETRKHPPAKIRKAAGEHRTIRLRPSYRHRGGQPCDRQISFQVPFVVSRPREFPP